MHLSTPRQIQPHHLMTGTGLIEALVALAVLALGVMGMAALQIRTLQESRATSGRAVAMRLVADLGERMRANPGMQSPVHSGSPLYQLGWGETPPATDCWNQACTPQDLARFDLMQWKSSLTQQLPGGDARVFPVDSGPHEFGILIGWPLLPGGPSSPAAPGGGHGSCPVGLICHLVYVQP